MSVGEQDSSKPHVCVCICTYKRRELLARLLEKLQTQETDGRFTFSAVVADNDVDRSAESLVAEFSASSTLEIVYCSEPRKNIALVRNKAIAHARGGFIAFIDDDEFPTPLWLAQLLRTCESTGAAGVLGPVRPHFDHTPPAWLVKGRFCERPEYPTGTELPWTKCRTGNVLFRRSILDERQEPFREEFGTGGEDQDFFRRMSEAGCRFVWCNEGDVFETVPPDRWAKSYHFKRALLRGRNGLKHPSRRKLIAQSLVAVPLYSVAAPVSLLFGQHIFMKFGIRFCDHMGRLLTVVGLNPVDQR